LRVNKRRRLMLSSSIRLDIRGMSFLPICNSFYTHSAPVLSLSPHPCYTHPTFIVAIPSPVTASAPSHISSAIQCAASLRIPVIPRSGGPSHAAYSLGGSLSPPLKPLHSARPAERSLIIDLRLFDHVHINLPAGTASIGAGALLGNIHEELAKNGVLIPASGDALQGLGSQALTAGFGPTVRWVLAPSSRLTAVGLTVRLHGLLLDSVEAMEVVLANGSMARLSNDSVPDLFWVSSYAVRSATRREPPCRA